MTSAAIAAARVERLVEIERRDRPLAAARRTVARMVGLTPSAIEDVQRGRIKRLCADVYQRIVRAFISALQEEIARAGHELEMARQCGLEPSSDEMARLAAAVADAQRLLGGGGAP